MNSHSSIRISSRILIVMHGHEPAEWDLDVCDAASMWVSPTIRVLAVLDVPTPPFTSLTPMARRAYSEALEARRLEGEARLQVSINRMMPLLLGAVEVAHVRPIHGRPGRTIAEHARSWSAHVIVIAPSAPGLRTWLWPGSLHRELLRYASCAVMIVPSRTAPPEQKNCKVSAELQHATARGTV